MSTGITIHRVKKVDIENIIHDTFETIRINIVNDENEKVEVCLFSENKRMALDVLKAFTIDGSNSSIAETREE